jgi:hypothetical protein
MRLYEKGGLSLDDSMLRYLPREFIQGIHVAEWEKDILGEVNVSKQWCVDSFL